MKGAGYDVRESNALKPGISSPGWAVPRLRLWVALRCFGTLCAAGPRGVPQSAGPSGDPEAYRRYVNEIYRTDAYHSLSIEGYSVTPALVERVAAWRLGPRA